jgi:protein-S-isoprenylcysteine O-methyltransferase Ste14
MNPSANSIKTESKSLHPLHWLAPLLLAVFFLLAHVALPIQLSSLSTRHGWAGRRPGRWNVLGLLLIVPGVAGSLRLIALHFRSSPRSFTELKPTEKLLTRDAYAYSRNPMYLLELLCWFGWALYYGSIPVLIGALLWLAAFKYLVPWEERGLESRFGEPYRQYKRAVPRWFGRP